MTTFIDQPAGVTTATGALLDTRSQEEKDKDWLHEEFAFGEKTPVIWEKKADYKEYYPYEQGSSLSCVAGGIAITIEYLESLENHHIIPSRKDIYYARVNYPSGGMMMPDAFKIGIRGACYENQLMSQGLGETAMNKEYKVTDEMIASRSKHALGGWVSVANITDYDELARLVDERPLVAFWFFDNNFSYQEWWRQFPQIVNNKMTRFGKGVARHQACIVDRTLFNGKKYFVVQDTSGHGTGFGVNKNLRLVSEDFMFSRLYAVGYGINKPTPVDTDKPTGIKLTQNLQVGSTGEEVKMLQKVLIHEKLLPIKQPTGYFGGATRKAVVRFQEKYASEILTPANLKKGTGLVRTNTRNLINKLYA